MKLTIITDANYAYFAGVLLDWWENHPEHLLFIGLLDEHDVAVGALAVELEGAFARLKHIAIDPSKQRRGYGSFLLKSLHDMLLTSFVTDLHSILYLLQEGLETETPVSAREAVAPPQCANAVEQGLVRFLARNGFSFYDLALQRNSYRLSDLANSKLPTAQSPCIKCYGQLSLEELFTLSNKTGAPSGQIPSLHQALYTEASDQLSRFWVEHGQVLAMVHCISETDGIRLDAIYAENGYLRQLIPLYGAALVGLRALYPADTLVHIDTTGQKLLAYQARILPCKPIYTRKGYIAACHI